MTRCTTILIMGGCAVIRINLSEILGRYRITQAELIRRTGIRPGTINKMYHERIHRLEMEHLDKICKVLNCQPGDLLEYIPDND